MPWRKTGKVVSVGELAKQLGGRLYGADSALVSGICPAEEPTENCIAFTKKHLAKEIGRLINETPIVSLLVDQQASIPEISEGKSIIVIADPAIASRSLCNIFYSHYHPHSGVSAKADISPSASIGENAAIGAFAVIGDGVVIEKNVTIYPHVVIYPNVRVGANTVIHAHAVIREETVIGSDSVILNGAIVGGDGFGYLPDPEQVLSAIPQVGGVRLASGVDVGSNACIDRGTLAETRIGKGTKIDNLVQVGHNVTIGEHAILCGQVGIAGSVNIGNRVVLGGGAGVGDHVSIPDRTRLAAHSGLTENVEKAGDYAGMPVLPIMEWRRLHSLLRYLVPRSKKLRALLEGDQ